MLLSLSGLPVRPLLLREGDVVCGPARAEPRLLVRVGAAGAGRAVSGPAVSRSIASAGGARCPCTWSPSCVLTFAHVAMAEGVRYGLAQAGSDVWMKNTTLVDAGHAHVLPELRLGDDDLLGHHRLLARDGLLPRRAGPRAQGQPARDPSRRGAAAGAAAPAAPALSLQHAQRDLGADAPRRRGRRPDAGRA